MHWRLMAWSVFVMGVTAAALTLIARAAPDFNADSSTEDTVLRAGYALEPPYAYRDAQGTLHGEAIDILRTALQRAGLPEPVWVHVEFPRLLHELQSGRIDVIAAGMFITPERAAQVDFTRPTTSVRSGLLVQRGNPLDLHALEDLGRAHGARLAVLEGSVELAQARAAGLTEAQLVRLPDPTSAVAALRSGQAAAFSLSAPSLRWVMRESPTLDMAAPFSVPRRDGQPDIGYPAFVFRPGDPRRARIDQALSGYLGSAEHLRAVADYGFSAEEIAAAHGMDPTSRSRGARP
jgi:polar amino acid transport system substrate-binding protein